MGRPYVLLLSVKNSWRVELFLISLRFVLNIVVFQIDLLTLSHRLPYMHVIERETPPEIAVQY